MATKKAATAKKKSGRFSFIDALHDGIVKTATVTRTGEVKLKKAELKQAVETAFQHGAVRAAGGERIRFPFIGALVRKEVKARKAGTGTNPFTGETIKIQARPASKKPRWSFPKTLKEVFANKKHW